MLVHPHIKFYFTEPDKGLDILLPEEIPLTKDFEPIRINSFCSGRYCAHKCLEEFGMLSFPVLMKKNGAPQLPEGFVGSISHSKNLAGVIIARKENYQSIGLDIEEINRIQPDLWHLLFTSKEQLFLSKHTEQEQQVLATVLFSVKEAFYKLCSEFTDDFIDFLDVEVYQENNKYFIHPLRNIRGFRSNQTSLDVDVHITDKIVISRIVWIVHPTPSLSLA